MSHSEDAARAPGDTPSVQARTSRGAASGAQLDEPRQAGVEPLVSILTFCAHPSMAYGTLLIFKTVRVGFPNAQIEVFDNGSHPEVAKQIARAAADVGATFQALAPRHYADHYEWLLLEREHDTRPLVLVDPDVIFWERVEHWTFGEALAAGRLIPEFSEDRFTSRPRLHPSLFWVHDVARLRREIARRHSTNPTWDCIGPSPKQPGAARQVLYDTLAPLYEALREQCFAFGAEHLDCYDHIFHGSHLPINAGCEHPGFEKITAGHLAAAAGDLAAIRGIWRLQEEYFSSDHACPRLERERLPRALLSAKALQDVQGFEFSDEELGGALQGLLVRMCFLPRAPKGRPRNV